MIYVLFSFDQVKDFLPFSGSFLSGISASVGSKAGAMDEMVNSHQASAVKNETFFLLSQSLSGVAGPIPLMVLLPSSSNVGKEKTKTIHVNKKLGGGNETKPNQTRLS